MKDDTLVSRGRTTPFLVREGWSALRRSGRGSLLAALMTAIAIFAAGLLWCAASGLERLARGWAAQSRLVAYLSPGATDADRADLERAILASGLSRGITHVTSEEAKARLARMYSALASAAAVADPAAFPASVEVDFRSGVPSAARVSLARTLATMPAVDEVQYDRDWIDRLSRLSRGIRVAGILLLVLLGSGAALIAGAAMRLSLFEAQDEVRVLRLVGATERVIRGPYLVAGAAVGFCGSLAAVICLLLTTRLTNRLAIAALPLLPDGIVASPGLVDGVALLLLGTAASTFGSWSASRETKQIR